METGRYGELKCCVLSNEPKAINLSLILNPKKMLFHEYIPLFPIKTGRLDCIDTIIWHCSQEKV